MPNLIPLKDAINIDTQRKDAAMLAEKGFSPEAIAIATGITEFRPGVKEYIAQGLHNYPSTYRGLPDDAGSYADMYGPTETQQVLPRISDINVFRGAAQEAISSGGIPSKYSVAGVYRPRSDDLITSDYAEKSGNPDFLKQIVNHETQHAIDRKAVINSMDFYSDYPEAGKKYDYLRDPLEMRAYLSEETSAGYPGLTNAQIIRNLDRLGIHSAATSSASDIDSIRDAFHYEGAWPEYKKISKSVRSGR